IEERLASTWTASAQSFLDALDEQLEIEKEDSQPTLSSYATKSFDKVPLKKTITKKEDQKEISKKNSKEVSSASNASVIKSESPDESTLQVKKSKKKNSSKKRKEEEKKKEILKKKNKTKSLAQAKKEMELERQETSSSVSLETFVSPSLPASPAKDGKPLVSVVESAPSSDETLSSCIETKEKRTVVDGFFYVTYNANEEKSLFQNGLQPSRYERQVKPEEENISSNSEKDQE
ncbi:MAG: hypothetical protein K2H85_01570, partial [Allobaculum sp.]|nr:hypothetical protein [Allobaculum sp.]